MDTTGSSTNFAKLGQDLADKTADKVQTGIRTVKDASTHTADKLSDKVEIGKEPGVAACLPCATLEP